MNPPLLLRMSQNPRRRQQGKVWEKGWESPCLHRVKRWEAEKEEPAEGAAEAWQRERRGKRPHPEPEGLWWVNKRLQQSIKV